MINRIVFQYDTTEIETRSNVKQYHDVVIYTSAPAQDWSEVVSNFCVHKHRRDLKPKTISNIIFHTVERIKGDNADDLR